jgi:hypothetical protein
MEDTPLFAVTRISSRINRFQAGPEAAAARRGLFREEDARDPVASLRTCSTRGDLSGELSMYGTFAKR